VVILIKSDFSPFSSSTGNESGSRSSNTSRLREVLFSALGVRDSCCRARAASCISCRFGACTSGASEPSRTWLFVVLFQRSGWTSEDWFCKRCLLVRRELVCGVQLSDVRYSPCVLFQPLSNRDAFFPRKADYTQDWTFITLLFPNADVTKFTSSRNNLTYVLKRLNRQPRSSAFSRGASFSAEPQSAQTQQWGWAATQAFQEHCLFYAASSKETLQQ